MWKFQTPTTSEQRKRKLDALVIAITPIRKRTLHSERMKHMREIQRSR